MKWAMSDDYVALLTTLIVAVFAVGTIQLYTLLKRWGDSQTERIRLIYQARRRVLEAMRQGQALDEQDLRQACAANFGRLRLGLSSYVASLVWGAIVTVLGGIQIRILRWSASGNHPADPELARTAFYCVTFAVALLLAEGCVRAFGQMSWDHWVEAKPLREYSRSQRREMNRAIGEYQRTGQMPRPPAPPSSP